MLFDSHAHYNDERFKDDVDEVLSAMNENNVGLILNSCSSLDEVPDIFAICEKYPFVYASVGIHPHEVSELTEADMDKLKEYAKNPKVKAIGEMICTPKVRHFWRCIFLWQRKGKNIENTRQNSNYLL